MANDSTGVLPGLMNGGCHIVRVDSAASSAESRADDKYCGPKSSWRENLLGASSSAWRRPRNHMSDKSASSQERLHGRIDCAMRVCRYLRGFSGRALSR
jgi:hypothetical protein